MTVHTASVLPGIEKAGIDSENMPVKKQLPKKVNDA